MSKLFVGSIGSSKGVKGSLSGHGEGIYSLDWKESELKLLSTTNAENAGIICLSHNKQYLYCANETKDFTGLNGSGGGVTAFKIKDNELIQLNSSISYGSRPAYVSISEDDKYLFVANHGSHTTVTCSYVKDENGNYVLKRGFDESSVAVFEVNGDGSIGKLCDLKVFDGHGYWCHGGGQSTSHIHCVKSKGDLVIACNRGADEIEMMRFNRKTKQLEIIERYHTPRAFAPRHFVFGEDEYIYVVNENYPVVSVYQIKNNHLNLIQNIGSMDDVYYIDHPIPNYLKKEAVIDEVNTSAMADMSRVMPSDIHISSDNKNLYITNRCLKGKGSLATFQINNNHTLTLLDVKKFNGSDPRGFNVTKDKKILVSLCDQDRLEIYETNEDGIPHTKIKEITLNSPVSIQMDFNK